MLRLVARRAVVQRRLLGCVLALVTAGATLLGVCTLLLTSSQDRAFTQAVRQSPARSLDVTAFLVTVRSHDVPAAADAARRVVTSAVAPLRSTTSSVAVSSMRRLGDAHRRAYLTSDDEVAARARLTSGRWPQPGSSAVEAAVPDSAARLLRLVLGQRVVLGRETGDSQVERPVTVVVVGTFRPRSLTDWQQDPLSGKGFDAAYNDGVTQGPAYGPFVVTGSALLASGSTVDALQVTARPATAAVTRDELSRVAGTVDAADARLTAVLGDRVEISRVASDLPQTLAVISAQQAATRSTVLVVLLLGTTLAAAALLLAGRLASVVRGQEQSLLAALGADQRQAITAAAVEALLLGVVAAVLAVPAAAVVHAWLTHLPGLARAGLAQAPALTTTVVLVVAGGAVLLATAVAVPALHQGQQLTAPGRWAGAARSGLDVVLVALAAAGWWQLRSQPETTANSGDAVRVVAPVLCVTAAAVVAVRCVPPLLELAARSTRRARSLLLPLAAHEAARRQHAVTASVLLAVAASAATFGLSLRATWERSQDEQAALRVGTDLSLTLTAPPSSQQAAAVRRATGGEVSAVATRPVALGRYVGDQGAAPFLVAVDARHAGAFLRGRPPAGRTWSQVGAALAPARPVTGVALPRDGAGIEVDGVLGTGPATGVSVVPTVVLQDASGLRSTVAAAPVPLDGRRHRLRLPTDVGPGQRLVAAQLVVAASPAARLPAGAGLGSVCVTLRVPGTTQPAAGWTVRRVEEPGAAPVPAAQVSLTRTGTGTASPSTTIATTAVVDVVDLAYLDAELQLTAFDPPATVPVAVSQQLAGSVGAKVGGTFTVSTEGVDVPVRVVATVPFVPSAPGVVAVLADADTLSRSLIGAGQLEPVVDAWWVGSPSQGAAARARALGLGDVATRAETAAELSGGPLRVTVPAALVTLVLAAVVLMLAGTAVLLTADVESRATELARLRALGLTRRDVVGCLLLQHAAVLTLLVLAGAAVGAAASVAIGPLLVRSDVGLAPVPTPQARWPWLPEAGLVAGLVLGCVLITVAVSVAQVRRADAALLRTTE